MDKETSLLGRSTVPRYTFLGSRDPPKNTARRLQCCVSAFLIALLLVTIAIILWYYFDPALSKETPNNSSQPLDGLLRLKWPLMEENYNDSIMDLDVEKRAFRVGVESLRDRDIIEEALPVIPVDSPVFRHQIATHTSEEAQRLSRLGYILNMGAREMHKCKNITKSRRWALSRDLDWYIKESYNEDTKCLPLVYRTANGTCNNLRNRNWGAALRPFRRILLPKYEDGISEPRLASNGNPLPSARKVSLSIHRPAYRNDVNFTVMLAVWGQFIDHDITATAISRGKNGSVTKCCNTTPVHPECFPVLLEQSDPFYLQYNTSCIEFVRSAPAPARSFGPREQLNQVTSFLDGSVVYGNEDAVMVRLRTFSGGELKMLKTSGGNLLPVSEDPNDGCNMREEFERGRYCFLSGDERSNENILLTSMHLLFARYHNFIARQLTVVNPHWTDEKLFQETKKIVAAQIQHITFREFLPAILPQRLLDHLNISVASSGYSHSYDPYVDPTIANVFASAAFRFGHSLLPGLIRLWQNDSNSAEYIQLHKMLFDPFKLFETEVLERYLKGAMSTSSGKSDVYFTQEVSQKLFQRQRDGPCGLDLVSLNIQRGRDHGLPPYVDWRAVCGLYRPEDFDALKEEIEETTLMELKNLYKSVNDVDVYTGGLAEKPIEGGMLGPTLSCLLADQFLRLKIGDRFWYETGEESERFTKEQLTEIRETSLATIICKTSGVKQSQPQVMRAAGPDNEIQSCDQFPAPNFAAWEEP